LTIFDHFGQLQVLMGRMNQLEKKLADEKKMRGKVKNKTNKIMDASAYFLYQGWFGI
jgi:hypothetical protein